MENKEPSQAFLLERRIAQFGKTVLASSSSRRIGIFASVALFYTGSVLLDEKGRSSNDAAAGVGVFFVSVGFSIFVLFTAAECMSRCLRIPQTGYWPEDHEWPSPNPDSPDNL